MGTLLIDRARGLYFTRPRLRFVRFLPRGSLRVFACSSLVFQFRETALNSPLPPINFGSVHRSRVLLPLFACQFESDAISKTSPPNTAPRHWPAQRQHAGATHTQSPASTSAALALGHVSEAAGAAVCYRRLGQWSRRGSSHPCANCRSFHHRGQPTILPISPSSITVDPNIQQEKNCRERSDSFLSRVHPPHPAHGWVACRRELPRFF